MNWAATPAVGDLHPELPGWTEQLAIAIAASGNAHDIRMDQGDRISVADDAGERRRVRWARLLIAFAVAFGLGAAGVLGANRFLRTASVSSPPSVQSPSTPTGIANSSAGYRIATKPTIVRRADRPASAHAPAVAKAVAATKIAHAKPVRATVPPAPSTSDYVPPAPPPASSTAPSTAEPRIAPPVEARLTPVPETRPTTIDGWVLREVVNGTAVLEGPDGIWRVKRGDTVPGIGQIVSIFGWGNRLIVATDKGLISTP